MKKIILIANNARAMLLFRLCFVRELLGLGFEVVVCAPYDKASFEDLRKNGVKTLTIQISRNGINPFREVLSFLQMGKVLYQYRTCFFIFYTIKPVIYGSLAAYFFRLKNVFSMVTGLGYVFIGTEFKKKFLSVVVRMFYKFVLRANKKVFFLNKDDREYFLCNHMVKDKQAVLLNGEGVDVLHYQLAELPKKAIFLFLGRLVKDKGIYEYVAAATALKEKYPGVIFNLAGDVDDYPTSIKKIELNQWRDSGVVKYHGFVSDVRQIIKKSSVLVLPSYREGTPVSVLEAMAMGRPIVTTDAPGCRETVVNEVNGYLIPERNVASLVLAMENFILKPDLILRMGAESRRIAEEKYDVEKINRVIFKAMGVL